MFIEIKSNFLKVIVVLIIVIFLLIYYKHGRNIFISQYNREYIEKILKEDKSIIEKYGIVDDYRITKNGYVLRSYYVDDGYAYFYITIHGSKSSGSTTMRLYKNSKSKKIIGYRTGLDLKCND